MFQKPSPQIALSYEEEPQMAVHHSPDEVETVVGPSVQVEGDFSSEGNIIVKGIVSGSVKTSRLLSVENGAKILANVKAGNAIVAGSIRGNISVAERLELTETAEILGDMNCQILVVAPGAVLQGKISMGVSEEDRTEKRRSSQKSKTRTLDTENQDTMAE